MYLFPKKPAFIGLDLGPTHLKLAVLEEKRGEYHTILTKHIPLEQADLLQESLPKQGVIVTAVDSRHVLVRALSIPLKREKDIQAALEFQAESLLPYPLEEAVMQPQKIGLKGKSTELALLSVKKDHLKQHIENVQTIGVEPERITCAPLALAAFSTTLSQVEEPQLYVHIGKREVTIALVQKGVLLKAFSFERKRDFKTEIQKTILSLFSTATVFEAIVLLGEAHPTAREVLEEVSEKNVVHDIDNREFALPIGLALAAARPHSPNFRTHEFRYPYPLRRMRTLLLTLSLTASMALATFAVYVALSLKHDKEMTREQFATYFPQEDVANLSTTTTFQETLFEIEKRLSNQQETFPLLPLMPHVKDLLAHIASLLEAHEAQLELCRYELISKPSSLHPKERYCGRLSLEVTAEDPKKAHHLHELLKEASPLIDTNRGITWESRKGRYFVTFYVKDKTRYY